MEVNQSRKFPFSPMDVIIRVSYYPDSFSPDTADLGLWTTWYLQKI